MTPLKRPDGKRTPTKYKVKGGVKKDRYIKLSVTEDEMHALEGLAKDWRCSVASAVRTCILMSSVVPVIIDEFPEQVSKKLVDPSQYAELKYRLIALKRFVHHWSALPPSEIVDK